MLVEFEWYVLCSILNRAVCDNEDYLHRNGWWWWVVIDGLEVSAAIPRNPSLKTGSNSGSTDPGSKDPLPQQPYSQPNEAGSSSPNANTPGAIMTLPRISQELVSLTGPLLMASQLAKLPEVCFPVGTKGNV